MLNTDDANGEIIRYEVCYELGPAVLNCTTNKTIITVDNTADVTGLTPAMLYTVAVRAVTKVGNGPLGERMSVTTLESGELYLIII
jgi:hypothetical protein